jgi:hypothetical protein
VDVAPVVVGEAAGSSVDVPSGGRGVKVATAGCVEVGGSGDIGVGVANVSVGTGVDAGVPGVPGVQLATLTLRTNSHTNVHTLIFEPPFVLAIAHHLLLTYRRSHGSICVYTYNDELPVRVAKKRNVNSHGVGMAR